MNIAYEILAIARKNASRKIIIDCSDGSEYNYGDLVEEVSAYAGGLIKAGVKKGGRVALVLPNSPEFIFLMLAVMRVEAVAVPINPFLGTMELEEIVPNSDPCIMIVHDSFVRPENMSYFSGRKVYVLGKKKESFSDVSELRCLEKIDLPGSSNEDNMPASINYTYRGFGYPLGVIVPHKQYLYGAKALASGQRRWVGQRMLVIVPVSYIFSLIACVFVPLLKKAVIIFCNSLKLNRLFSIIEKYSVQTIAAVPEEYGLISKYDSKGYDLSSLKLFISGGSVLAKDMYERIKKKFKVELLHGYGLTEFTPVSRNVEKHARAGTVGPLCPEVQARIYKPDKSKKGEIQIKSKYMFLGYNKRENEYRDSFEDGWFKTGDSGFFSGSHLVFDKEIKRTCKKNGNMVDLAEVEKALLELDFIKKAAVSCSYGKMTAEIILSNGSCKVAESDVKIKLKNRIASWKIPEIIVFK